MRWHELADGGVTSDVEGVEGASSERERIRPVDLSVIENEERDGGREKRGGGMRE